MTGKRAVAGAAAALLVVFLVVAVYLRPQRSGINVLLISIDTLRADHLGAYGYPRPTSPNIDRRLAAAGVTFEQVFSQSPKTTPSHMTMLTSLYPCVHRVWMWQGTAPGPVLNPAVPTLAEVLRRAGYATAAFTGGAHMDPSRGFDHGFDTYVASHGLQLGPARRWIKHHRRQKFFVFYHTYKVHDPYLPPLRLVRRFAPDYRGPLLETVRRLRAMPTDTAGWEHAHKLFWASVDRNDPRDVRFVVSLYDAAIRYMDRSTVATLLDDLDRYGLTRRTLVVFTSDHGEAFGEHGAFLHDDLYAGTLHVPLILRLPGRLAAGKRVWQRVRLLDVMPTILDLVGVGVPSSVQGRSVVPLIQGMDAGGRRPTVISEHDSPARGGRALVSLRSGPFAYIVEGPSERLFDASTDPGERENVAAGRPVVLARMHAELVRWRRRCKLLAARYAPRGRLVAPGRETARELRALGYVE